MSHAQARSGFTTVEVLVTLFVAVLLLGGGYQAYSAVASNSREGRERSIASNIAYENARRVADGITGVCVPSGPTNHSSRIPADSTLPSNKQMTTIVTCPYGSSNSTISLVNVTITYGSENVKVSHALYTK